MFFSTIFVAKGYYAVNHVLSRILKEFAIF
jgi:hypothetical protein